MPADRSSVAISMERTALRANEARYFKNKFDPDFTVEPANKRTMVLKTPIHRPQPDSKDPWYGISGGALIPFALAVALGRRRRSAV